MALNAGSVTVDDDGNRSGSGLALALYDAEIAAQPVDPSTLPDDLKLSAWEAFARAEDPSLAGPTAAHAAALAAAVAALSPSEKATAEADLLEAEWKPAIVSSRRALATRAEAYAAAIVSHFAANADVRVPQDSLDAGVPSVTRVLTGALE